MARDDDIEALLAEVERSLGNREPARRAPAPGSSAVPVEAGPGGWSEHLVARVRLGGISAAVSAAVVFGVFAVTPFVGAISGAAGAALATFVLVLVRPRSR